MGLPALLAPIAIKAGTKLFSKILGGKKERDAGNADREAFAENERRRVEAERIGHGDTERLRTSRAGAIGDKLAGTKYNIPPELLQAALQEKGFTGYERTAPEVTGSMGSDILGGVADTAGDAADAYMRGIGREGGTPPIAGGGAIAPAAPGGQPFATPNLDVRFKAPKLR